MTHAADPADEDELALAGAGRVRWDRPRPARFRSPARMTAPALRPSSRPRRFSLRRASCTSRSFSYRSIVTSVDALFSTDETLLISAAAMPARISPRRPVGISVLTSSRYAMSCRGRLGNSLNAMMPGQDEEERRDDAQKTRADDAHARVPFVLRAEHALDHVLARARVPDADREEAGEHARDRETLVRRREEDVELLRVRRP